MEFEKKIAVLGSTGSIGTQTLEIAREYKGIKIEAMSAHSNIDLIEKQAREFKPKTVCITDEEKAKRTAAIQQAYKDAAMVPFEIGELAYQIFDLAELASKKGNQNLITDGIIAAINARAAVKAAFLNVRINLSGIKDEAFVADITTKMKAIETGLDDKEAAIIALYV